MKPFEYEVATDPADAIARVGDRADAAFLAGGTNLVDHMKLGIAEPRVLIDVNRLGLDGVDELPDGGVRIGAGVRNSELAAHPLIRERYPVLSQALLAGASGQLRNLATTAGNLMQRTRCVYFQDLSTPCNKRDPGAGCSAIGGYERYHAILGASEHCIATHPSDMAVAMAALDAEVQIEGSNGSRAVPLTGFHRLPGDRPERDTVLERGELITAVDLPAPLAEAQTAYRKVRDRASFAFALVSVAAVVRVVEDQIAEIRIAIGGVAHKPWRATVAEEALQGEAPSERAFRDAAEGELAQATPLVGNAFKVPMATNTIVSVLRELTGT
jgi:xanthine dehydrogenase YagS FAD-binding subunit